MEWHRRKESGMIRRSILYFFFFSAVSTYKSDWSLSMNLERERLYTIARHQKSMLMALLAMVVGTPAFFLLEVFATNILAEVLPANIQALVEKIGVLVLLLAIMGVALWLSIAYFRLAFAMETGVTAIVLYILGLLLPFVSLMMMLIISNNATQSLKAEGYKVGLLCNLRL